MKDKKRTERMKKKLVRQLGFYQMFVDMLLIAVYWFGIANM